MLIQFFAIALYTLNEEKILCLFDCQSKVHKIEQMIFQDEGIKKITTLFETL